MKNVQVGDEVLIVGTPEPRGKWRMGHIKKVHPGKDDLVQAVTIRTNNGNLTRPITKICPLGPISRHTDPRGQNRQSGEDGSAESFAVSRPGLNR
eukprot:TCALIF_11112-PA protein Name:"Protein of unknown function" AED:0.35 eAED:0.35 QI:0/-1/0/1/-1/1/1/0/94